MISDFPPEFPEAARAHVRWVLERLGDPLGRSGDPQVTDHCTDICAERAGITLHRLVPQLGPYTFLGWSLTDDGLEALRMRNGRGSDADLCFRFGPEPEHKITKLAVRPLLPPGMAVRLAASGDWPLLEDLLHAFPITRTGGRQMLAEPGPGFRHRQALAGHLTAALVTHYGKPAGMMCATIVRLRYDGRAQPFSYLHHLREIPAMQGLGLFPHLSAILMDRLYDQYRHICSLVHPDNARAKDMVPVEPWSERIERITLACDGVEPSAAPLARPATSADLPRLVQLFNATHARAAMFEPYTEETLARRLSLDQSLYGFGDVFLSAHAAIGLWRGSDREAIADGSPSRRTGLILDYAADGEAGLAELPFLFRQAQALAAHRGVSMMTAITSPRAACYRTMQALRPAGVTPFLFYAAPERPGMAAHGIHLDNAMISGLNAPNAP